MAFSNQNKLNEFSTVSTENVQHSDFISIISTLLFYQNRSFRIKYAVRTTIIITIVLTIPFSLSIINNKDVAKGENIIQC